MEREINNGCSCGFKKTCNRRKKSISKRISQKRQEKILAAIQDKYFKEGKIKRPPVPIFEDDGLNKDELKRLARNTPAKSHQLEYSFMPGEKRQHLAFPGNEKHYESEYNMPDNIMESIRRLKEEKKQRASKSQSCKSGGKYKRQARKTRRRN